MRTLIFIPLLLLSQSIFSQEKSLKPSNFNRMHFLGKSQALIAKNPLAPEESSDEKPELETFDELAISSGQKTKDPMVQSEFVKDESIPIIKSFDGVGSFTMPNPDTEGDVGPIHYFQMVKSSFGIWDKQGNLLYGPAANKTIWSDFQGPWLEYNWTDPIVIYDHLNDRWLASAMVYDLYNEYYEMIAVSATPDPLGEWYCYSLWFDVMPDYPKFGVWPDGYYLTINEWELSSSVTLFTGASILVFNPEELMAGQTDPTVIYFHFDAPNGSTTTDLGSFLPSDLDGPPPPAGTPNYHICVRDDAWGYPEDRLWIWECAVDWIDTSNCHFSEVVVLETAPFDSHIVQNDFIHQPGTSLKLHSLTHFMMYRLQFRSFGDYQTLVCNHTVEVDGNEHAGVRWYELRNEGNGWFIHQQSSFAPDADSRWMGSITMDADGNIGLGYSVSSDTTYPSIRVSGRRDADDPEILSIGEGEIVEGAGCQVNNPRWGDYSMMAVDPVDDLTFWYTQEYLPVTGTFVWQTKIASFQLHKNLTFSDDSIVFNTYEDCLNGIVLTLYNNSQFDIEIEDIEPDGGFGSALWYIDPFNFNFPFTLEKGDSIEFDVYIGIPVDKSMKGFLSDTLDIITDYKHHTVSIFVNEELLTDIKNEIQGDVNLIQAFPNPFIKDIRIQINLQQESSMGMEILDLSERIINTLMPVDIVEKGEHIIHWDGLNASGNEVEDGIYFCRAKINGKVFIRKIIKQ
ncbi:MAG: T9SS type A sorting domain-containing protein [Bacteroidales bacterium]